ncbi:hypothetical protein F5B18DRAFT_137931 [Nemania serpens]|nr:hypothetical protein F5B18DRAFT_137931 [Nemania serpens]
MCRGSQIQMTCGHVQTYFRALCGQKCSSPQGPTTYLDKPCPQCDPKNRKKNLDRIAEFMAQLRPQENADKIQQLAEAGRDLNRSMRRNIAEVRCIAFGKPTSDRPPSAPSDESYTAGRTNGRGRAPWEESDSDSDSTRLSMDMKHVIEKKYKLIDGHWSVISYRWELDEVDPDLLLKLKDKREKELAKEKRKEEKRKGMNGRDNNIGIPGATIGGVKSRSPKLRYGAPAAPAPPSSPNNMNFPQANPRDGRPKPTLDEPHVASTKDAHARMQTAFASLPPSSNSFRARVEHDGFLAPPFEEATREHDSGSQAEGSATTAGRTLRRSRAQVWVDKFADDITYDDDDDADADVSDSDSADSLVTVYGSSELQKGQCRSASYGKSRRPGDEDEVKDLDIWQRIADEDDEDDEGGAPLKK